MPYNINIIFYQGLKVFPGNTYPCSPQFDSMCENPEHISRLSTGSSTVSSYASSSSSSSNVSRNVKKEETSNSSLAKLSRGQVEVPDKEKDIHKELDDQNSKNTEAYNKFMKNFRGGKN